MIPYCFIMVKTRLKKQRNSFIVSKIEGTVRLITCRLSARIYLLANAARMRRRPGSRTYKLGGVRNHACIRTQGNPNQCTRLSFACIMTEHTAIHAMSENWVSWSIDRNELGKATSTLRRTDGQQARHRQGHIAPFWAWDYVSTVYPGYRPLWQSQLPLCFDICRGSNSVSYVNWDFPTLHYRGDIYECSFILQKAHPYRIYELYCGLLS